MREAKIALCKCAEGHLPYGIRFEKIEESWVATWAFPIKKEGSAEREGYSNSEIVGMINRHSDYPGCPYCGAKLFIICGNCKKLNCYVPSAEEETFVCHWCGHEGVITSYEGTGINAGSDI